MSKAKKLFKKKLGIMNKVHKFIDPIGALIVANDRKNFEKIMGISPMKSAAATPVSDGRRAAIDEATTEKKEETDIVAARRRRQGAGPGSTLLTTTDDENQLMSKSTLLGL